MRARLSDEKPPKYKPTFTLQGIAGAYSAGQAALSPEGAGLSDNPTVVDIHGL
jgi:hypothetical protein